MTKQLKHILCIDDDDDIRNVTKMSLEMIGEFSVTDLDSGEEAVSKTESINPDVILLDVMMPKMDGPSTLKILRKNSSLDDVPIILMTARVQPAEIEEYIKIGAAGVIHKPFDPMTLSSEIKKIWDKFHK